MHQPCVLCLGMASVFPSCSVENLSCPICLEVLNCPVSTPCGHNFCRACIETSWRGKFSYTCPLCNKVFQKRPDLRVNYLVTDLADQFRSNLQVNEQHCAKPEDWTTVEVCPQPDVRTVSRAQDQLEETLNVRTENPRDLKAALEKCECLFRLIHHNTPIDGKTIHTAGGDVRSFKSYWV